MTYLNYHTILSSQKIPLLKLIGGTIFTGWLTGLPLPIGSLPLLFGELVDILNLGGPVTVFCRLLLFLRLWLLPSVTDLSWLPWNAFYFFFANFFELFMFTAWRNNYVYRQFLPYIESERSFPCFRNSKSIETKIVDKIIMKRISKAGILFIFHILRIITITIFVAILAV